MNRGKMGGTIAGIRLRVKKLNLAPEDETLVLAAVSGKDNTVPDLTKQIIKRIKEIAADNVPVVVRYTRKAGWITYSFESWNNKIKNLNNQPAISFKNKTVYDEKTDLA